MHFWSSYMIMHGNQVVADIRRDGTCTIYAPKFMPYNLYLEDNAERWNLKWNDRDYWR